LEVNILVHVIGNPWRRYPDSYAWQEVKYSLDEDIECRERSLRTEEGVRARTTIPILYKCIKPEHVILIVQDTILASQPRGESYSCVIETVESQIRRFLEDVSGDLYSEIRDKTRIIVAPGVGRFVNKTTINGGEVDVHINMCGNLQDFYSYVLLRMAYNLLEVVRRSSGGGGDITLKVHLDLTHGINYMPTLTYKALLDVIPIIATYANEERAGIGEGGDPRLRVYLATYNSEPVIPLVRGEHEYVIHVVEKLIVRSNGNLGLTPTFEAPQDAKLLAPSRRCVERLNLNVEEVSKEVNQVSKDILGKLESNPSSLSAFAGSLVNGLPLLLLKTMPKTSLSYYVENLLEAYVNSINVRLTPSTNSITLEVSRKARLTRASIAIAKLLLARDLIKLRYELEYSDDNGISLSDLQKLASIAFGWNERLRLVIANDIRTIENRVKGCSSGVACEKLQGGEWVMLKEIFEESREGVEECREDFLRESNEQRNFIQHSGLHRCLVEVRMQDNRIMVRYNSELYKKQENLLHSIASKGLVGVKI